MGRREGLHDNRVALARMRDPEGMPDDLLANMLELLTLGAIAKSAP